MISLIWNSVFPLVASSGIVFVLSLCTSCIRNGRVFRNLFDWFKCCGQTRLAPKVFAPGALCNFVGWHTRRVRYTNTKHTLHTPIFIVLRETPAWEIFVRLQLELNYIHRWLAQRCPFWTCAWTFSLHLPFFFWFIVHFSSHVKFNSLLFILISGTPWRFTGHCRRHWQEPSDAKDNASHDERNWKGLPFLLLHWQSPCIFTLYF